MKHRNTMWTLAVGLVLLAAQAGFAQDANTAQDDNARAGRKARHGRHLGEMIKQLNLSEAQQAQMKSIHEGQRDQMRAIHEDDSLTREQKMEKMQALRQSNQSAIQNILTPEQQQKWQQIKKDNKGKHGKKHRGGRRGGDGQRPGNS